VGHVALTNQLKVVFCVLVHTGVCVCVCARVCACVWKGSVWACACLGAGWYLYVQRHPVYYIDLTAVIWNRIFNSVTHLI
jgi:hypothetical protein